MFLWFPTIISDETVPVQFSNGPNKMKLHFDDRSSVQLWLPDCKVLALQYAHRPSGGQSIELFDNIVHWHHNFQGRHLRYQDLCKLDAGLLFIWNIETQR